MNLLRTGMLLAALTALFLACGCDDRERKVVRVQPERQHYCSVDCHHHYWDSQRTTYVKVDRHRHGPGCGHRWDGHHWVAVRRVERAPRGHQCTVDCHDHHYDGDRVVIRGSGFGVTEFCRPRATLRVLGVVIARAVVNPNNGNFATRWVIPEAIGPGVRRITVRQNCESGKDGSLVLVRGTGWVFIR